MNHQAMSDDARRPRRSWWTVTLREARQHAIVLAAATWLVSIVTTFGITGRESLVGVLKAPDFVHFYTFGTLAREGRIRDAYDWERFHAEQVWLVPESTNAIYPPVYPPQVAVLFIPFSRVSFERAALIWSVITVLGYGLMVWRAWAAVREWLPDPVLVFAAAAGFPPFWQAVMNGQVTILIVLACFLGWIALDRGHRFWAGAAFGLLAMKPQFGLPFAVIVLARRDWRMLVGALSSVAAQAAIVWFVMGSDAFSAYAAMLPTIAEHADELEPKPFQSHSIRSLTRLLPTVLGSSLWLVLAALVLWGTARMWLTGGLLTVRLGVVLLAAVLVNPHLIVYDATILIFPLIWFGAWLNRQRLETDTTSGEALTVERYGGWIYALIIAFIAPSAALIGLQFSVILMLWLFWNMHRLTLKKASVCLQPD